jgi:hypothetical protein
MKKKGKTKQQILLEEKTKPFLNDYSVQVQDKIKRKKIEEATRKIADAAEQRIEKLNAELNFVKEELSQEIEKRKHVVEILRKQEPLLSERVKEIGCLYSVIGVLGNKKYASDEEKIHDIVELIPNGWQYPEDTCVRIILEGREYKTGKNQQKMKGLFIWKKGRLSMSLRNFLAKCLSLSLRRKLK